MLVSTLFVFTKMIFWTPQSVARIKNIIIATTENLSGAGTGNANVCIRYAIQIVDMTENTKDIVVATMYDPTYPDPMP